MLNDNLKCGKKIKERKYVLRGDLKCKELKGVL